ncbi:hypothetical protein EVG20_g3346 [Dentipellis fragilis]|uniref:BTB domain-containing protein n=1 Tax=Dentipellis fragilis TaxID=205917 RepID=A0A4Y9Z2U9_9AGAM|nr:hypothetical protein EVG20_g3346 [Dentipellis fragilis]
MYHRRPQSPSDLKKQRLQEEYDEVEEEGALGHFMVFGQRHEHLWFGDGTIVLRADDTRYRVHADILETCSSEFKRMLETETKDEGSLVVGVPLLVLDDEPIYVECMLNFFYKISEVEEYETGASPSYLYLKAWLHMGQKYAIKTLWMAAVDHIVRVYPPGLSDFEMRYEYTCTEEGEEYGLDALDAYLVADLALSYDLHSVLPIALFCICDEPPDELFKVRTIVKDSVLGQEMYDKTEAEIMKRCYIGRGRLRALQHMELMTTLYAPVSDACTQKEKCKEITKSLYEETQEKNWFSDADRGHMWMRNSISASVCPNCRDFYEQQDKESRAKHWSKLGTMFTP